jgi:predicted Zn-dependent peptidase
MKAEKVKKSIHTHQLSCGAHLIVEQIDGVASCALKWLVPAGSACDPTGSIGVSAMLEELLFRGAGDLDTRSLSDAMDRCGLQRHTHVGTHHLQLSGLCTAGELDLAIDLLSTVMLSPTLPADSLEAVRSLCLQELDALEDDPRSEVMLRLRQQHRCAPFNRSGYGERESLESMDLEAVRAAWQTSVVPEGSIISIAGNVEAQQLSDRFESLLSTWSGGHAEPAIEAAADRGVSHITRDSNQSHIAMAWDAPNASDEDTLLEHVVCRILSGSSSGRLFTEVRQKRSLCYSVGASYRAGRDDGVISLYAGTTPDRAQETLDVCRAECDRMREGVSADELTRAQLGLESEVVMGGESTAARTSALAMDWYKLGRVRTLQEVITELRAVTLEELNGYLARREHGEPTLVTMGPEPLKA